MTWDDAEVREMLDAQERRAHERLRAVRGDLHEIVSSSDGANTDDEHDPEGSTIAFERQQVAALIRDAQDRLAEIAAARQRLEDGSYGSCAACGQQIITERLRARPAARRCAACA